MKTPGIWPFKRSHHGIVLDVSLNEFEKGSIAFASIFANDEDPRNLFLFYSGAQDVQWSHSSIGLAKSRDGFNFQKVSGNPVLEGTANSFCYREAMTPVVAKISNRFCMIFSGRPNLQSSRRIGIAKVRIRGPSLSQIEVNKLSTNPLKHLNGPKGSWHACTRLSIKKHLAINKSI